MLRVKGRGVATKKKGPGDLLAEVQVAVPTHLTAEQKDVLKQYREVAPEGSPRDDLLQRARAAAR